MKEAFEKKIKLITEKFRVVTDEVLDVKAQEVKVDEQGKTNIRKSFSLNAAGCRRKKGKKGKKMKSATS